MSAAGRFVWDELMTPKQGEASEFYRSIFGWNAEEMDMGEQGTYLMMKKGDAMVGGIAAAPPEVPQHWLGYLAVDDVDAAAGKIEKLGGTLVNKPFDIPNVGRAVFAKDATGAGFAAFKGSNPDQVPSEDPTMHGTCWHELVTDDVEKAAEFYRSLAGYTTEPMGEDVLLLKQGDAMRGSIRKKPEMAAKSGAPNHWLTYFLVEDVGASTAKAEGAGAKVLLPSTDIPNMGTFSIVSDPQGGVFALWKNAPKA